MATFEHLALGNPPQPPDDRAAVRSVGIWQAASPGHQVPFVRCPRLGDSRLWADVEVIEPKAGRRVVLIGESVARGFYYDPAFNPALSLRTIFEASLDVRDLDVVDLASIGIPLDALWKVAAASMALDPDALIVFAGNNWHPYQNLDWPSRYELARILRGNHGWRGARVYAENYLRSSVSRFVAGLAELASQFGVAIVLVLPDFNLADWRNEKGDRVCYLGEGSSKKWEASRQAAEAALAEGEIDYAALCAARMLELDGGTSPLGFEIMAACRISQGDRAEARRLLEEARDTELSRPAFRTPRCFSVTQSELRESARRRGIALVDLPQVFGQELRGELPGGGLFHDYCHLTARGIQVAMAATASTLLRIWGYPDGSFDEAAASAVPPPQVRAEAHLLAAIHNAHWGQPLGRVKQECDTALYEDPQVANAMLQFLDLYVRQTPSVFSRSFVELQSQGRTATTHNLSWTADPYTERVLNPVLLRALFEVLQGVEPGVEQRFRRLVAEEHGSLLDKDLLRFPCYCRSFADREFEWIRVKAHYTAYDRRSEFRFYCARRSPGRLRVTCRVRATGPSEPAIRVSVNSHLVGTIAACQTWSNAELEIAPEMFCCGENALVIEWPLVDWCDDREAKCIATRLERGLVPQLYPEYGEVHELRLLFPSAQLPLNGAGEG